MNKARHSGRWSPEGQVGGPGTGAGGSGGPHRLVSRLLGPSDGGPGLEHGFATPPLASSGKIWRPRQVHGAAIVHVRVIDTPPADADGAVSTIPGVGVGVLAADCVPLLLASRSGRVVAAVHAGWRGIAAGIVERSVASIRQLAPRLDLLAVLGPAAGLCCYEVGPEVVDALAPRRRRLVRGRTGRPRVDLRGLVADRIADAGGPRAAIERVGPCTICSARWPSYRRQGAVAGRLLGFVFPRDDAS